jgi:hypothetical protein
MECQTRTTFRDVLAYSSRSHSSQNLLQLTNMCETPKDVRDWSVAETDSAVYSVKCKSKDIDVVL